MSAHRCYPSVAECGVHVTGYGMSGARGVKHDATLAVDTLSPHKCARVLIKRRRSSALCVKITWLVLVCQRTPSPKPPGDEDNLEQSENTIGIDEEREIGEEQDWNRI